MYFHQPCRNWRRGSCLIESGSIVDMLATATTKSMEHANSSNTSISLQYEAFRDLVLSNLSNSVIMTTILPVPGDIEAFRTLLFHVEAPFLMRKSVFDLYWHCVDNVWSRSSIWHTAPSNGPAYTTTSYSYRFARKPNAPIGLKDTKTDHKSTCRNHEPTKCPFGLNASISTNQIA